MRMLFVPIFIIKLPNSNRNPGLLSDLNTLGLEFRVQEGVIGSELTRMEILEKVNLRGCKARLGQEITKASIGAGLSHQRVYREINHAEYKWALILEEDVHLSDFNAQQILKALQLIDESPTIIQLFSRGTRLLAQNSITQLEENRILFDFLPRLSGSGASSYLINLSAVKLAVESNKLNGSSDWPDWGRNIKQKGLYPWMISESGEGSTIPFSNLPRLKYIIRRVLQFSGIHYLWYRKEYKSFVTYCKEELIPYIVYLSWRARGSKYYLNDPQGPQTF